MKYFIKNYLLQIVVSIVGALGGYFYWLKVGCLSGSCPLQSNWYFSAVWGAIIANLLYSILKDSWNKPSKKK
ncbi:MAG: DUF6132 family protein [Bacteroidales bacterium]